MAELTALQKRLETLDRQALKKNGIFRQSDAINANARNLEDLRGAYNNVMRASGDFEVRTIKSTSAVEAYSKRIAEQKVHIGEAITRYKDFNKVVDQQLKLQRAQAVAWKQMPNGQMSADLIMPNDAASRLMKTRMQISVFNDLLKSSADNMVKWGKNTQWAGRQLTVGFSVPMSIAAAATGKLAFEMDKSLTNITKVYGDANSTLQDSVEGIRMSAMQTAKNMATLYGQSAKDTLEIQAQFAAAGKTGVELQNATAAATRARMLNEIDLQTAISASIALQTVYGLSAEELGQKWDYINAVANQTILGAEDFAVAIPKVSGVMKELNGTLEDQGVLLTAFKAAGIDAAEGANALKTISFRSVSAYGKGLDTFTKMTGQDLNQIVKQTNGETIPTLLAMYKAMENLSTPQRIAVVKDVFGIYQGNKALILLEQLAEQGGQVSQAMAVGKNSVAENAKIANQELERMNQQPFKRIQKAIESVKIAMAEMGKTVLPIAADALETISDLLTGRKGIVESLGDFVQHLADLPAGIKAALVVGVAGPLTMLAGLFVNLVGNALKVMGALGGLAAKYKITNAEERTQILLAEQAAQTTNKQSAAVAALALEMQKLNTAMATQNELNARAAAAAAPSRPPMGVHNTPYAVEKNKQGTTVYRNINTGRYDPEFVAQRNAAASGEVERAEWKRLGIMQEQAQIMDAQRDKMIGLTRNIGAATMGAGLLATMFGPGDGVLGHIGQASLVLGTFATMMPTLSMNIVKSVVAPFKAVGTAMLTATNMTGRFSAGITSAGAGMKALASAAAGPLAIALAGALVYWNKVNDAQEKSLEKTKNLINSTKDMSSLLGVNYQDATGVPGTTATGGDAAAQLAQKFRETNADAANAFNEQSGKKIGDKWGIAIAEGVKVRLHGGTVEAAKQATRVAMELMGERFSDAAFAVQLKFNFENPEAMIKTQVDSIQRDMQTALNDLGTGMERWNREHGFAPGGNNDLTKAGAEQAKAAGKDFFNLLRALPSPQERKSVYDQFVKDNSTELQDVYDRLVKANASALKRVRNGKTVNLSYEDFLGQVSKGDKMGMDKVLGMSQDEIDAYRKRLDLIQTVVRSIAEQAGGNNQSDRNKLFDPKQLEQYLKNLFLIDDAQQKAQGVDISPDGQKKMQDEYANALMQTTMRTGKLTDAQQLQILNQIRLSHGLTAATSLTQGFSQAQIDAAETTKTLAQNLQALGMQTTEEQVTNTYKSAITGTIDDYSNLAQSQLDTYNQNIMDGLDKQMNDEMKQYDDKADKLNEKFDKQKEAFDKRWDARKQRESDYYDNRIKKVDEAIKKEEKAEEIRQRIYEAEKARIERMSQMYNKNIDFNSALNTGNLDEAAKIANDMQAQTAQWSLDDTMANSGDTSKQTIDRLNGQKDAISKAKDERLKALDDQKKAEEDALKHSQDMEKKRLDNAKDATRQWYEDKKKATQADLDNRKRTLDLELATIRAYIPRNKAEMDKQIAQINGAYQKYGVTLHGYGQSWSNDVSTLWRANMAKAGNALTSDVKWATIGAEISTGLLKGGFGMTPAQFAAWLNGGDAPAGSIMAPKAKKAPIHYGSEGRNKNGGTNTRGGALHTGGIVGNTRDYSRVGYSGGLGQSEVNMTLLRGEGVLNRKATDMIGEENIAALNSGKLPKNTGPWGGSAAMAGAMAAAATKNVMGAVLQNLVARRMQQEMGVGEFAAKAGSSGKYGNVALSQEQLNNAATIIGVGRSMGMSQRDLIIGIMTAMQESTLRNLSGGDRDSIGLFQQRPSQGWGTPDQIRNPSYAARKFFSTLQGVKNRDKMSLSAAAQAVQRSAYPEAYAKWETMARSVVGGTQVMNLDAITGLGSGINLGQYGTPTGNWTMPASGPVTSHYGMRVNPVTGVYRLHAGSDIGAGMGAAIYAARGGRVLSVQSPGQSGGYGNYTIIDHGGGQRTAYAHQSKVLVSPGQVVAAGQRIGSVGSTGNSTGPHLHFEYMKDGKRVNPNEIIPQLWKGGHTMNTGLANLHPKETVLTAPLSAQLKEGIGKLAAGDSIGYTVTVDLRGSTIQSDVDIEKAVNKALDKRESRLGRKRTVGGN